MKKQLLACIFTFFFTNLMLAQSINFTSSTLTTAEIGSTITVNYQYTSSVSGQIYCGINLLDDWTWVSLVATAQLNPAPAGTNVTGSFQLTIPAGTTPTANLTGALNYKINIELKNGSVWLAGDYPPNQINLTPSTTIAPAISITSIPASTQVGTNLVVNYKYTAASAGKTSIAVTKNGGANPWDFISTVAYIELDPAVAGTDVTGTFTVPIPSTTTHTSALTGNENYRIVLELKNTSGTWLAGDYSTVGYNFTELLSTSDFEKSKISVYPNPSSDFIYFNGFENQTISQVSIVDLLGKNVFTSSSISDNKVAVSNLNSGIYFLSITSNNSLKRIKFIKN